MAFRRSLLTAVLAAIAVPTLAHADPLKLSPAWVESYQVWSSHVEPNVNLSYLQNRGTQFYEGSLSGELGSLFDDQHARAWRQRYEDTNRDYEQKQRAGLSNPTLEQWHRDSTSQFGNDVLNDVEKQKIQATGDQTFKSAEQDKTARAVMTPAAVAVGVWTGKPLNVRVNDDTQVSLRTSLKDKLSQVELHSPILYGSFEFHPQAPDSYNLVSSTNVDFGQAMDFNHLADFGAERYQLKIARDVPFLNLTSSVVYGGSSNVVASSLTKQLTPHIAAVVDSVYFLTPYDPDHVLEERVRLRYDLHF